MGDAVPLDGVSVVNHLHQGQGVVAQVGVVHGDFHVSAAKGSMPVPQQLPAGTAHFTGREAQLRRLDQHLLSSSRLPSVAVISGAAGVGKSALAVHWAHRVTGRFPGGQLFADLSGFGPDAPALPATTLSAFLRAFGVARPDEWVDLAERAAHLRTLLSGRHVLLVLDNVRSAEQIRSLLPGCGTCAVVVTSRNRLTSVAVQHAALNVELKSLSVGKGVELLSRTIGARVAGEPSAAARIVDQCGGLPLALTVLAHHTAVRPALRLRELATELENHQRRLDVLSSDDPMFSVRAALFRSYRGLAAGPASAFRLFGRLPGRLLDAEAFAAAMGADVTTATETLNELVGEHLVVEPKPGRYSTHDLLRAYAAELGDEHADDSGAVRRLFDHYLATAVRADRLITPNRFQVADSAAADLSVGLVPADAEGARNWMRSELATLVALFQVDDPALDSHLWQLAYTLRGYFYLSRELDAWLHTHDVALRATLRLGDGRAEAITRNNLGMVLAAVRRLDEAAEQHHAAGALFEALGDRRGTSDSLANLGAVLSRQRRFEEALWHQQKALSYYLADGLARNSGITLRSMSNAHAALGQLGDAVRCAEEALSLALVGKHDMDIAQAANTLGAARERGQDHVRAEVALRQALTHAERCGSVHEQAKARWALGRVALATGNIADAESSLRAALAFYQRVDSPFADSVSNVLAGLAKR
ncbi:tetratricopeptide repeat protein [Lentzea sp. BCCO 10_0856]|uniref:Tetratricopeptide repeat protein n=1 Tax=Lentzea miocenica TaxID=3095431 RepID=A0ABU4TAW6_9PSEU|nr:tetratricopeptide repeat protein [Lentzea sp. BCCO 10_0856]MDX8035312.1 tetratricopeptide repeat protein [Lentzea sp. BCCO 10_0856]